MENFYSNNIQYPHAFSSISPLQITHSTFVLQYIQNAKHVLTKDPTYVYDLQHESSWTIDEILNAARCEYP